MRLGRLVFALGLAISVALATIARAEEAAAPPAEAAPAQPAVPPSNDTRQSICLMVEAAARANGLPVEFFARVIWQESRFGPDRVGPRTRSGERAQGIAQFMPGTAAERGLLDPFDPVQALPKSAEFLRELAGEFGNLGLAAAAYNAGPRRVRDWLEGRAGLPGETRRYVEAITGHTAEEWAGAAKSGEAPKDERPASAAKPTCGTMMAMLRDRPNLFMEQLQQHVAKSAGALWGVQVSAGFSREKVLASYATFESRPRDSLSGLD